MRPSAMHSAATALRHSLQLNSSAHVTPCKLLQTAESFKNSRKHNAQCRHCQFDTIPQSSNLTQLQQRWFQEVVLVLEFPPDPKHFGWYFVWPASRNVGCWHHCWSYLDGTSFGQPTLREAGQTKYHPKNVSGQVGTP